MEKSRQGKSSAPAKLLEGVHYYIEDGKYVFTARYLRERGYCCRSGCRHCPYGFVKKNGA